MRRQTIVPAYKDDGSYERDDDLAPRVHTHPEILGNSEWGQDERSLNAWVGRDDPTEDMGMDYPCGCVIGIARKR